MKKYIIIVLVLAFLSLAFLGYLYLNNLWFFDKFRNVNIADLNDFAFDIMTECDEDFIVIEDSKEIEEKYKGFSKDYVKSTVLITSFIDIEAFEIGIFKLKDKKYIDDVKEILENRAKDIIKYYENYMYSQLEVAKNYEIKVYNDTVILIVHNNKDRIIKYIEERILKGM